MIVEVKARRASIIRDEPSASFVPERVMRQAISCVGTKPGRRNVRVLVEILRQGGGMMPRALLGGEFTPSESGELLVELYTSQDVLHGEPTCISGLSSSLVPGLPEEFAAAVLRALVCENLSSGRLVVDRAAFDPVESSPFVFGLASHLLSVALASIYNGTDLEADVISELEGWP